MKGLCVVALVAALCVAPFRAERPPSGVLRPMPRPGTEGVHTLPALLPDHLRSSHRQTRPSYRPDVPSFQRPQIQPRHPSFNVQTKPLPRPVGAITLPAELPEDFRQTRPALRPTSYVPHAESEICQSCERLTFVRRGACCKRWNLCC